jgi:hypothetical protein
MAKVCTLGVQPTCTGSCEWVRTCNAATKAGDDEFGVDAKTAKELRDITETTGLAKSGYRVRVIEDSQVNV